MKGMVCLTSNMREFNQRKFTKQIPTKNKKKNINEIRQHHRQLKNDFYLFLLFRQPRHLLIIHIPFGMTNQENLKFRFRIFCLDLHRSRNVDAI